jgi:outer membrane protein assembly factor BamB
VALDATDGSLRWRTEVAKDGAVGTPAIADGLVFAGVGLDADDSAAHAVVGLDAISGKLRWRYASPTLAQIYTPAIAGRQAYVFGHDRQVVCLDAATGTVEWSVARASDLEALAIVPGQAIYVIDNGGPAAALDPLTGAEIWSVAARGVPVAPAVVDGYLLIATDIGILYAISGPG